MRHWKIGAGLFIGFAAWTLACGGAVVPDDTGATSGKATSSPAPTSDASTYSTSSSSSSSGAVSQVAKHNPDGVCGLAPSDTCTPSELATYQSCITQAVLPFQNGCFGQNWKSGDYTGGNCEAWAKCQLACDCNDVTCLAKCAPLIEDTPPGLLACGDCVMSFNYVSEISPCTPPACLGAHTCSDLGGCCPSLLGNARSECETISQVLVDSVCNAAYSDLCR